VEETHQLLFTAGFIKEGCEWKGVGLMSENLAEQVKNYFCLNVFAAGVFSGNPQLS
jgi:hypothetical protein